MVNLFVVNLFKILVLFLIITANTLFVSAYSITPFSTMGVDGTQPYDILFDPTTGDIYTSNETEYNVSKITSLGVNSIFGTTGTNPIGIAIDDDGNIYTANYGSDNVTKITPLGVSSVLGTTDVFPFDITIDSSGNIYTANYFADNVTKITPLGVSSILGTTGSNPFAIAIDNAGNIYTANQGSDNVTKITPLGVSSVFGTTGTSPYGITIDDDGNIYTSNRGSDNVTKITPLGVSSIFGTTGTDPFDVIYDSFSGNIYVSNESSDNVTRITPLGVSSIVGTTGDLPYRLALDTDGSIYIANYGPSSVSKITFPVLTEVSPVSTPSSDDTPSYTFNALTDTPNTITYGGPCSSLTNTAVSGNNTITFETLPDGVYNTCTITVTDSFGDSNVLTITPFTIDAVEDEPEPSRRSSGSRVRQNIIITPLTNINSPENIVSNNRCPHFTKYIKLHSPLNDKNEVMLWQEFLNKYENENLVVDGIYGLKSYDAIKLFQEKYKADVLIPWGLKGPTGWIYQSTRVKGNNIVNCPEGKKLLDNGNFVE